MDFNINLRAKGPGEQKPFSVADAEAELIKNQLFSSWSAILSRPYPLYFILKIFYGAVSLL